MCAPGAGAPKWVEVDRACVRPSPAEHAGTFVSCLSSGGGSVPLCALPGSRRFAGLGTRLLWVLGPTPHPLETRGEGLALPQRDALSRCEIKVRPQHPWGGQNQHLRVQNSGNPSERLCPSESRAYAARARPFPPPDLLLGKQVLRAADSPESHAA